MIISLNRLTGGIKLIGRLTEKILIRYKTSRERPKSAPAQGSKKVYSQICKGHIRLESRVFRNSKHQKKYEIVLF